MLVSACEWPSVLSDCIRSRSSNTNAPETACFDVFFCRLDRDSAATVGGVCDIWLFVGFARFSLLLDVDGLVATAAAVAGTGGNRPAAGAVATPRVA